MKNALKWIILSNYRIFRYNKDLFETLWISEKETEKFKNLKKAYQDKLENHLKRLEFYKEKFKNDFEKSEVLKILTNKDMNLKEFDNFIKQNYPVQTWLNNPILRTKSKEVPIEEIKSDKIQEFWQILFRWMEIYDGVWLAAPQIGENIRMIAVCQFDKKLEKIIWADVCINPKILSKKWEFISEEWCLSLPWLEGKVKRAKEIEVEYYDLNWKKHTRKAYDYNAAIFQHEIDHLDWILFWDKVINKKPEFNIQKLNLSL